MASGVVFERLRAMAPTISVGVNAADMMELGSELSLLEQTDVELVHVDVMDGCFTPMMTVGPPFIKALKTPRFMWNPPPTFTGSFRSWAGWRTPMIRPGDWCGEWL